MNVFFSKDENVQKSWFHVPKILITAIDLICRKYLAVNHSMTTSRTLLLFIYFYPVADLNIISSQSSNFQFAPECGIWPCAHYKHLRFKFIQPHFFDKNTNLLSIENKSVSVSNHYITCHNFIRIGKNNFKDGVFIMQCDPEIT